MSAKPRVTVLVGGLSSEREISRMSGERMSGVLRERGYQVTDVDPGRDAAAQVRATEPEVVVNALHGTYGEDGCVQGLLEILGDLWAGRT